MDVPRKPQSDSTFSLSNLQVIMILLVGGIILIGATWVVASEFGRLPVSLWDICTSVVTDTDRSSSTSPAVAAPVAAPQKP